MNFGPVWVWQQTDRKQCIRAYRATCTGGLKNQSFFPIESSLIIITFLCKGCYALNAPFNVLTILIPGNVNTWNYKQVTMSKGATILIMRSWDSSILSSNRELGYPSSTHPSENDEYILNRRYSCNPCVLSLLFWFWIHRICTDLRGVGNSWKMGGNPPMGGLKHYHPICGHVMKCWLFIALQLR